MCVCWMFINITAQSRNSWSVLVQKDHEYNNNNKKDKFFATLYQFFFRNVRGTSFITIIFLCKAYPMLFSVSILYYAWRSKRDKSPSRIWLSNRYPYRFRYVSAWYIGRDNGTDAFSRALLLGFRMSCLQNNVHRCIE